MVIAAQILIVYSCVPAQPETGSSAVTGNVKSPASSGVPDSTPPADSPSPMRVSSSPALNFSGPLTHRPSLAEIGVGVYVTPTLPSGRVAGENVNGKSQVTAIV